MVASQEYSTYEGLTSGKGPLADSGGRTHRLLLGGASEPSAVV